MIEPGHKDPYHMARALVGYIDCDKRVQSAIRGEFVSSPSLSSIAKIRRARAKSDAAFARGPQAKGVEQAGWDWRGEKHENAMAKASQRLAMAVEEERQRVAR